MSESNTTQSTPLLLDVDQAAELLGVPSTTMSNLHRCGELKGHVVGKHLRWRRRDIERFVDRLGGGEGNADG